MSFSGNSGSRLRKRRRRPRPGGLGENTEGGALIASSAVLGNKPCCCLEQRALELLEEAATENKFLWYREARVALARLRIDRKTALKLLSELAEKGRIHQSCGHGVIISREIIEGGQ